MTEPAITLDPMAAGAAEEAILYPESDGEPRANNTEQFDWIVTTKENLELLYQHHVNVFIAGDLLWYPVEGNNQISQAPDVMVALGRPKGRRGAYLQWNEGNLPPQVVFEMISPGNRAGEMKAKFAFYEKYGVEEYYVYDPERGLVQGWLRSTRGQFRAIPDMQNWRSPWLNIRFQISTEGQLQLLYPDGSPFLTFAELDQRRSQAEAELLRQIALAETEAARAEAETVARMEAQALAEAEATRANAEAARAEAERQARLAAEAELRKMQEKLRQAGLL